MVDTADSKSAVRKNMPVRVRPPLPELIDSTLSSTDSGVFLYPLPTRHDQKKVTFNKMALPKKYGEPLI